MIAPVAKRRPSRKPGRRPGPPEKVRTEQVRVLCTVDEKEHIDRAAEALGQTMGEFLRELGMAKAKEVLGDNW